MTQRHDAPQEGWTTGRKKVWQNWPGALELLLAAQAKEVSVAWLDDAPAS